MDNYAATLFVALVGYGLYTALWRLYFGPLAHIPGPRLAALTYLYEAYHDAWRGGQYTFKIMDLHEKYGRIVRISPGEVHISDPNFYDSIYVSYSGSRRCNKDPYYTRFVGLDLSVFSTVQHELHHKRRAALQPYFSMASVRRLQPIIQERLDVMMQRIKDFKDTDKVLNASCMLAALGSDVVNIYSFARCGNKLEDPDFDPSSRNAALAGLKSIHIMKHISWVYKVIKALPRSVVQWLSPALAGFVAEGDASRAQVEEILSGQNAEWRLQDHPTIFHAILDSKLEPHEKTVERLSEDAQTIVMAGAITIATTLELITFWLLTQPQTLRKLKDELRSVMPSINDVGTVPLAVLESLPYLTAVIKEGLRLSYGLSTRSQRIDPTNSIEFFDKKGGKRWVIPPGTSVSMNSVQLHHDEDVFPASKQFIAERWLENPGLDRYLTSFSKGTRMCLGMNLAYGEMYLTLAYMWRLWGSRDATFGDDVGVIDLFETSTRDVEMEADYFIPTPQKGSEGIRVKAYSLQGTPRDRA